VLNAANEIAVGAFLDGSLGFTRIAERVEAVLNAFAPPPPRAIEDVHHIDTQARIHARRLLELA
jgi:1-deoxy-D-xylulose-5-phosphate reductoisomerase